MYAEKAKLQSVLAVGSEAYKELQKDCYANSRFRCFGTVAPKSKGEARLHRFTFDLLPSDDNTHCLARKNVTILKKNQEEEPWSSSSRETAEMIEECGELKPLKAKKGKRNFFKESEDEFLAMDTEEKKSATSYIMRYGQGEEDFLAWTILKEDEQVSECEMDKFRANSPVPTSESDEEGNGEGGSGGKEGRGSQIPVNPTVNDVLREEMKWDPDPTKVDYNATLFERFFPPVKGKSKILDEYLKRESTNPRQPNKWKSRVERDNIRFHQPDADDPDVRVSAFVPLLYCSCKLY